MTLLAYPNVSEGRDADVIAAIGAAFGDGPARRPLRSRPSPQRVHARRASRAGSPAAVVGGAARGGAADLHRRARRAFIRGSARSTSPRSSTSTRPTAGPPAPRRSCSPTGSAEELGLPVFLYGDPGRRAHPRRAAPRRPGRAGAGGSPPASWRPTSARGGCTRPPARCSSPPGRRWSPSTWSSRRRRRVQDAKRIAALIREGGTEGLPGVRAIGLWLDQSGLAQVSTNVEDHRATPAGRGRRGGRRHAPVAARRARRAGPAGGLRRTFRTTSRSAATPRSKMRCNVARAPRKLQSEHGSDQAQAPDQAPRQRRRNGRGARPDRAPAEPRGAQEAGREPSAREARLNKPPTWRGVDQQGAARRRLHVHLPARRSTRAGSLPALVFAVLALALYVPSGYYLDGFLYAPRRARSRRQTR